ncbi:MAG TPA: hypothetical protein VF623_15095 [Segetibacter sp.]|jgi:hypothetical protein
MLVRIVKSTFRQEEVENFKLFFEGRKEKIIAFEGCTYLELWQDSTHKNIFFTYSYRTDENRVEPLPQLIFL